MKISPLTNHKNSKKGAIKGGFDRTNLFQNVEEGFDKLFKNNRSLDESFEYYNTMKNGTIAEQLKMQQREYANIHVDEDVQAQQHKSVGTAIQPNVPTDIQPANQTKQSDLGLSSASGIFAPKVHGEDMEEIQKLKKKIRKGLGK